MFNFVTFSIQYEFPEALLVLEGQKLKEQGEEVVVGDGAGSADDCCDDRNNHLYAVSKILRILLLSLIQFVTI